MKSNFTYDSSKLVLVKSLSLYNANLCATANGIFKSVSTTEVDYEDLVHFVYSNYLNASYDAIGGEGNIPSGVDYIYPNLDTIKESLNSLTNDVSNFDEEVDRIIDAIISNMDDEDLAEEFRKSVENIEKEAMKDYLTLGSQGVAIDVVQLYKLLSKYKDDESLKLDENQKAMLSYYCDKMDYYNMSDLEKGFQTCVVFGASVVEGVLDVSESIVDGVVYIGGNVTSLGLAIMGDEEAAIGVRKATEDFVDTDYSSMSYDEFVEEAGLNNYIAYGEVHKLGLSVGHLAGETLITMIPGGGLAAKMSANMVRAMGESLEETVGEESEYRMAKSLISAAFCLFNDKIDNMSNDTAKDVAEVVSSEAEEVANGTVDYYYNGDEDEGYGEHMAKNHGGKMLGNLVTGIVKAKVGGEDDSISNDNDVELGKDVVYEAKADFVEGLEDVAKDEAKDIAKGSVENIIDNNIITTEENDYNEVYI